MKKLVFNKILNSISISTKYGARPKQSTTDFHRQIKSVNESAGLENKVILLFAKKITMAKKHSSILNENSLKFFERYINNPSPTGFESGGQKLWLDYLSPYIDDRFTDTYGTAVGVINPKADFKVAIEAHADEISWFVHYITKDGFIYLRRNGGSDHQIAPSKRVNIHTEKGMVKA